MPTDSDQQGGRPCTCCKLANQHNADSQAAAERGRLVSEVRRARQRRAGGLWAIAAARDLSRRLWGGTLVRTAETRTQGGRGRAVLRPLSNTVQTSEPRLSIYAGVAARPEGPGLAPEALGGGQMVCRRIGASNRRAQLRTTSNSNGRRATDRRPANVMAGAS